MDQCWYSEYKLEFIGEVKQKNKLMKKYIWAKDTPWYKKGESADEFDPLGRERLLAEGWIEEVGQWKPEMGEDYYTIYCTTLEVLKSVWDNDSTDKERYACGNYFKTEGGARAAIEKVKTLLLSLHE